MSHQTHSAVATAEHAGNGSTLPLTHADADTRGAAWAQAWNDRDIEAVLAHFDDRITFRSPIAVDVVGRGTLKGKADLRAYWEKALAGISSLHFTVERVLWDPQLRELGVMYVQSVNGKERHAIERMRLDDRGMVVEADALYGAPVDA